MEQPQLAARKHGPRSKRRKLPHDLLLLMDFTKPSTQRGQRHAHHHHQDEQCAQSKPKSSSGNRFDQCIPPKLLLYGKTSFSASKPLDALPPTGLPIAVEKRWMTFAQIHLGDM
jgi:hypothetical protein